MRQRIWIVSVLTACLASAGLINTARAEVVVNGNFEGSPDLTGWTTSGTVEIGTTDNVNHYAIFKEGNSNGLSRIYQTLPITFAADDPDLE